MMEEILIDSNEEMIVQNQENTIENEQTKKQKYEKEKIKYGDILCNRKTRVYAKLNSDGYVINVQSDVVLTDFEGWTLIDEGEGERFVFAQTRYFDKPLVDENGNYQIKLER